MFVYVGGGVRVGTIMMRKNNTIGPKEDFIRKYLIWEKWQWDAKHIECVYVNVTVGAGLIGYYHLLQILQLTWTHGLCITNDILQYLGLHKSKLRTKSIFTLTYCQIYQKLNFYVKREWIHERNSFLLRIWYLFRCYAMLIGRVMGHWVMGTRVG